MKYSKRQIEVWEAKERLSEKLSRMSPDEITACAQKAAAEWRRKTGAESVAMEGARPPAETPQSRPANV